VISEVLLIKRPLSNDSVVKPFPLCTVSAGYISQTLYDLSLHSASTASDC